MPRRAAILKAIVVTAALCLVLSGCRSQAAAPPGFDQPATPDIAATVQAALRSMEDRQPSTPPASIHPTPLAVQPAAPTTVPTLAPSRMSQIEPTQTPTLEPIGSAAMPSVSPNPPPMAPTTPPVDAAAPTTEIPTPTPIGADLRPAAAMFAGTFMDGNEHRLEDTVGTPTLLMFWAPW